jgi:hypothetical protein
VKACTVPSPARRKLLQAAFANVTTDAIIGTNAVCTAELNDVAVSLPAPSDTNVYNLTFPKGDLTAVSGVGFRVRV